MFVKKNNNEEFNIFTFSIFNDSKEWLFSVEYFYQYEEFENICSFRIVDSKGFGKLKKVSVSDDDEVTEAINKHFKNIYGNYKRK